MFTLKDRASALRKMTAHIPVCLPILVQVSDGGRNLELWDFLINLSNNHSLKLFEKKNYLKNTSGHLYLRLEFMVRNSDITSVSLEFTQLKQHQVNTECKM